MARKNNGSKAGKNGKPQWRGFVKIPLANTEDVAFLDEISGELSTDDFLLEIADRGYKVTVSQLRDGTGFVVSATGNREDCENAGFTTTTFAGSPRRGIMATWYKLAIKCEWGAWKEEAPEAGLEI